MSADVCPCGHGDDDHDELGLCLVQGCQCVEFRNDQEAEDGADVQELDFDQEPDLGEYDQNEDAA